MEISADKAYWVFESFQTRAIRIQFAGRISDEDASCDASIVAVDRELQLIVLELFAEDEANSWCRPIPLKDASFDMTMLGEPGFEYWAETPFHLVLILTYPDQTRLLFAERFSH